MKFIFGWLKANPIIAGLIAAVVVAIAIGAIKIFVASHEHSVAKHENQLINQGATNERLEQNQETLNAVQNANDAVNNPSTNDVERMRDRFNRARRPVHP